MFGPPPKINRGVIAQVLRNVQFCAEKLRWKKRCQARYKRRGRMLVSPGTVTERLHLPKSSSQTSSYHDSFIVRVERTPKRLYGE
jgi:hypothetical protein